MIIVLYDKKEDESAMQVMEESGKQVFGREDILFLEDCTRCLEPIESDKKQEIYAYIHKTGNLVEKAEEIYLYKNGRYYRIK